MKLFGLYIHKEDWKEVAKAQEKAGRAADERIARLTHKLANLEDALDAEHQAAVDKKNALDKTTEELHILQLQLNDIKGDDSITNKEYVRVFAQYRFYHANYNRLKLICENLKKDYSEQTRDSESEIAQKDAYIQKLELTVKQLRQSREYLLDEIAALKSRYQKMSYFDSIDELRLDEFFEQILKTDNDNEN